MFCTKCGNRTADHARFCPRCGASLAEERQVPPQPIAPPPPVQQSAPVYQTPPVYQAAPITVAVSPKPRASKKPLLLLLAVIIALGGYFYYQKYMTPEAKINDTLQRFCSSVNTYDINGALGCFDPAYTTLLQGAADIFGGFTGYDLRNAVSSLADIASNYAYYDSSAYPSPALSYTINYINLYDSSHADVSVTLRLGSGSGMETETMVLGMIKKDFNWYLNGRGILW